MKIWTILAAALILVLTAGPAASLESDNSCAALAAWAAGLETLPADYASFTALPVGNRRAVYQRLSAAERAGLWQEQWQQALQLPGWNAEQRALIAEAGRLMSSSAFAATSPSEAMLALEKRVGEVFPREEALRVFYRLGPRGASIEAKAVRVCDCTIGGTTNFCEVGDCQQVVCLQRIDGCGFSWEFPCDGRCV